VEGRQPLLLIVADHRLQVGLVLDLVAGELVEELLHRRLRRPLGRHRVEGVAVDLDLVGLPEYFAYLVSCLGHLHVSVPVSVSVPD